MLLILDLQRRERWLNMLRIVRLTSPMSVGAWVLAAFGASSGLAALGTLLDQVLGLRWGRTIARLGGMPAAATGGVMSYYTGALLGGTSTPLWAAGYRVLPPLAAASSVATATAAISLVVTASAAPPAAVRRVRRLAFVATSLELALSFVADRTWRCAGVSAPLDRPRLRALHHVSVAGMVLPLVAHSLQELSRRESRPIATAASLLILVAGYCLRAMIVLAGNASVEDPSIYLERTRQAATGAR